MSDHLEDRLLRFNETAATPLPAAMDLRRRGDLRRRRTRVAAVAFAVALLGGGTALGVTVLDRDPQVSLQPAGPSPSPSCTSSSGSSAYRSTLCLRGDPPQLEAGLLTSDDAEKASSAAGAWAAGETTEDALSVLLTCQSGDNFAASGVTRTLTRGAATIEQHLVQASGAGAQADLDTFAREVRDCPTRPAGDEGTESLELLPGLAADSVVVASTTTGCSSCRASALYVAVGRGDLVSVVILPVSERPRAATWAEVSRNRLGCVESCPSATAGPDVLDPTDVLRPDGIGPVRFGMTLDEARTAAGVELTAFSDDLGNGCGYVRVRSGSPDLSFMVIEDRVVRVDGGNQTRTEAGVGVGSTEAQVQAAYPSATTSQHQYDTSGHYLTVSQGAVSLVFETDGTRVTQLRGGENGPVSYVEGCA